MFSNVFSNSVSQSIRHCLLGTLCFVGSVGISQAATFEIDFSNGGGTAIGTFDAPVGGGSVSNFSVTLSGVTFDTSLGSATTFDYDPTIVEFTYSGGFASFTNSANYAACAPGECFLEIYPDPTPIPGDYLAVDKLLNNLGPGTKYQIDPVPVNPVPVPAGLALLLTALGGLAALAARRRTRTVSFGRSQTA